MDMNCTDFEVSVQDLLDRRKTELPDEFRAHATSCSDCRSFWQSQCRLLAAAGTWTKLEIPSDLTHAALRELTSNVRPAATLVTPRRLAGPSAGWVAVCSTAALVLFVAVLTLIEGPPDSPRPQHIALDGAVTSPVSHAIDDPSAPMMAGLLTGVQTEYLELSQSTTRVLDQWSDLPRASNLIPNFSGAAASPQESSPLWPRIDRPVSERVGQAFHFLWDALPQEEMRSS
jgi:hypothetical protein